jgi:flagellar basal body-associated protein FliL
MSDKKAEGAKPEGEAKPAAGKEEAAQGGSGGFKAWMPLIVTIVLMPVLAFTTTKFLILPKVVQARSGLDETAGRTPAGGESGHEASKDPGEHGKPKEGKESKGPGKKKQTVPITKVIVNVAGSMGARYLMASFTLVGTNNDFKSIIEDNKDQLLDLANTALASKTITDLEKPGARNQLRAELMSIFNNAIGGGVIQEIYFTEFAVQ